MSRRAAARPREGGYALVALMLVVALMLIALTAATPYWRYLSRNDKEEELIFRGGEIADAVARYQRRNGNALPPSIEVLVKGKFLRHPYKDPMTKDGKWRLIRPGDTIGPVGANPFDSRGGLGSNLPTTTTTTTTTRPSSFTSFSSTNPTTGFQGVVSTSTEKGLRIFNGRQKYSEWVFLPGQQRVIGRPAGGGLQPGNPFSPTRAGTPAGLPTPGGVPGGMPGAMPGGAMPGGGIGIPPNLAPPPPPADP